MLPASEEIVTKITGLANELILIAVFAGLAKVGPDVGDGLYPFSWASLRNLT